VTLIERFPEPMLSVTALLPVRFSKKPSLQLPLEGLFVLCMKCCGNSFHNLAAPSTSGSVDMQLFAACGTGLPGARQVSMCNHKVGMAKLEVIVRFI
jgi:hypothetical protein